MIYLEKKDCSSFCADMASHMHHTPQEETEKPFRIGEKEVEGKSCYNPRLL